MQGQSDYTVAKQDDLRQILSLLVSVHKEHGRVTLIDLNAGSGFNDAVGCPGSPLIMLNEAVRLKASTDIHAVEIRKGSARQLRERLAAALAGVDSQVTARVWHGNHSECSEEIVKLLGSRRGKWVRGVVYADPNGVSDFPGQALERFAQEFPRLDLLINISAVTVKRIRVYGAKNGCWNYSSLCDMIQPLQRFRQRLFVREPIGIRQQWTMLLLTNWADCPEMKKRGWFDAQTAEGQAIWNFLNLTQEEYPLDAQVSRPNFRTFRVVQRQMNFEETEC